jgi:putative SOS response-associated peptidase YedK
VILEEETVASWLHPSASDLSTLLPLLKPARDDALFAYAVSSLVNNVKNDAPDIIVPATAGMS